MRRGRGMEVNHTHVARNCWRSPLFRPINPYNPTACAEGRVPKRSQGGGVVSHPFVFRPNTHDEGVFHAVNTHNEYRLPETFRADDVIIDIGTHIGSFCYAALVRGSNHVYGFEASPENFARA